jgi:multimeric flavodoxin WrbA
MKIVILNGSPNLDKGATGTLLAALEKGLETEKPEITTKYIYRLEVKPCQGCFNCWTNTPGKCIHKDDMENILPIVAESDMLIIATPVYVDGMTGPMKTFIDRLIPLGKGRVELRNGHMRHFTREYSKKKIIALVSPSGFAEMDNFDPLVAHVKAIARNLNSSYAGEILAPSFWFYRYDEESYRKILETIASAGEGLVKNGKMPPHVSGTMIKHAPRDRVIEAMNRHYGKYE